MNNDLICRQDVINAFWKLDIELRPLAIDAITNMLNAVPSAQPEQCDFCKNRGLEDGDTLYISADWDGGIGFDFIRDIHYCPKCGRRL